MTTNNPFLQSCMTSLPAVWNMLLHASSGRKASLGLSNRNQLWNHLQVDWQSWSLLWDQVIHRVPKCEPFLVCNFAFSPVLKRCLWWWLDPSTLMAAKTATSLSLFSWIVIRLYTNLLISWCQPWEVLWTRIWLHPSSITCLEEGPG